MTLIKWDKMTLILMLAHHSIPYYPNCWWKHSHYVPVNFTLYVFKANSEDPIYPICFQYYGTQYCLRGTQTVVMTPNTARIWSNTFQFWICCHYVSTLMTHYVSKLRFFDPLRFRIPPMFSPTIRVGRYNEMILIVNREKLYMWFG